MNELTPQQNAALDYKRHISLVANAGSGKTFVLANRFVEIFINEEIDLSSIVAITFTEKAAGELNKKIANQIDERINYEDDSNKRKRLDKLRRELVSANISTIHSFCVSILKEFAPEAGIDAGFSPIDQTTSDEFIELAIEESMMGLIKNPIHSDSLKYLIRFFGSKSILKDQIAKAVNHRRKAEVIFAKIYSKTDEEILEFFTQEFKSGLTDIFGPQINSAMSYLRKINDAVFAKSPDNEKAIETLYWLNQIGSGEVSAKTISQLKNFLNCCLTKEFAIRKTGYLSKGRDDLIFEIEQVEKFFSEISKFFGIDDTEKSDLELLKFAKAFQIVFTNALDLYSKKKKQRSYLDFEDILLFANKIIAIKNVQEYLQNKFKYVMIDEYQDTNELQYDIVMPILNNLQNGNLFVVGDEKQSIYMFREAELEIFNKTKSEIAIQKDGGKLLSLPHSFRMSPPLVLFTNFVFQNLFKDPVKSFNEVEYSNLVCALDENEKGYVKILLADEESEITESQLVASEIQNLLSRESQLNYSDIAILCRKRSSFGELEQVFSKAGIPFSIIGGKGFYQRQSIYDIYSYLTFLLDNANDSALIAILRSPYFSLSDSLIYSISKSEGKTFFDKLKNVSYEKEWLKNIVAKLTENSSKAFSISIVKLIRKLLNESGYWAVLAAKQNSIQEIANVKKLLSLARDYSLKPFNSLYDFTVALKESIESQEGEAQAQVIHNDDTVKMMTIHQAKGMEYKAVFIFGANEKSQEDNLKSKSISFDKKLGIITKVPINSNFFDKYSTPSVAALYNYLIFRKNRAELKRLFYVAVTRAKKYLFISARHKQFKHSEGSFFQLIKDCFGDGIEKQSVELNSEIELMKMVDSEYNFYKKQIALNVEIQNEPSLVEEFDNSRKIEQIEKKVLDQKIIDRPKNEIISATKISMFDQCPVKYQLTYELGYTPLLKYTLQSENNFDFSPNEEENSNQHAQLKGKLIHLALSKNIQPSMLAKFLDDQFIKEGAVDTIELKKSITTSLTAFMSSSAYTELQKNSNVRNEFEIYCKEGEHYLYGIIDKLIYEENKLTVVDYKTDSIPDAKINQRAESYFPQLKFYAYILSKLYPNVIQFQLHLVFIKHPHSVVKLLLNRNEIDNYNSHIENAITKIYSSNFQPNYSHCKQCQFAAEGDKCIKF